MDLSYIIKLSSLSMMGVAHKSFSWPIRNEGWETSRNSNWSQ